ncbi:MAG: ATP-dependent DNA helicase RecG [Psychrobacter glaciei]|jgi:ATP-dependent DNA helicase RecG|uniref:ATP-binding protein n=1 Tax=Psychrobacter glaciei TaxID=619771 RepID=UPI0039E2FEC9
MESQTVEYKSDIPIKSNPFKAEIVAFLNTNDGTIFLGFDDDGTLIPEKIDQYKQWESWISDWIHSAFNIPVQKFVTIEVSAQNFAIHIKQGDKPPYYYKDGEGFNSKGIYIRNGSSKRRATDDEVRRMLKAQVANEFESEPSSVQKSLTFHYLQDKLLDNNIVFDSKGLRLQNIDNQYNNGALLLSEQNSRVTKIAVIDGLDMSADFLAKKEFNGSLIKQIDMTLEYISLLNDRRVSFTGAAARLEHESYPSKAIREAVINAYAHRDYSLSADIKVEVYDDRIEIFSAGGLPDGLSVADIKEGISAQRNPNIVHVLDKINYIENFATGIRRILASYKDFDKEPMFIVTPNQFKVILYNRHYAVVDDEKQGWVNNNLKKNLSEAEQLELGFTLQDSLLENDTMVVGVKQYIDANDEKIIKILTLNGDKSRQEIQDYLQESKTKVHQRLTKLIELNLISKRGQSRAIVYFANANERK